jgi:hypothetical protein
MLSVETKLAMAAAFNGSMLDSMFLTRENLKNFILWQMNEYFRRTPAEGSQFDGEKVLAELETVPDDERSYRGLLNVLADIGFRSVPNYEALTSRVYMLEATLWESFIDGAVQEWNQNENGPTVPPQPVGRNEK